MFKEPEDILDADPQLVLDLLVLIALSGDDYKNGYDTKSKQYLDNCLEKLEAKFRGTVLFEVEGLKDNQEKLHYHPALKNTENVFKKVLV